MSKSVLLSGFHFNDGPSLVFDRFSGPVERFSVPLTNHSFTLTAQDERFCTGSFDLAILEGSPCKDQTSLVNTTNNSCYPCFEETGFNPSFYHMDKSDISAQQRAYNMLPHAVYLAYFTDGLIKVGISSDKRKEVRWVEQGARWVAHILSCENAYEARHNEERISKELKLPEVVLGKKKRSIISSALNEQLAKESLISLIDKIEVELKIPCQHGLIYGFDQIYNPSGIKLKHTILDLTEEKGKKISGKFVGLYGDLLIVENDQKQFMFSLKKMIAHQVEMIDSLESVDFQPQQITLF
ncbi:MAG: hypothetical protein ACI837_002826 [Crocinitomicaceae bacterium]|jgi:hypothetical protein